MAATDTVGIARLVLYRRERAVMLEPRGRGIVLWTLHYGDEVREPPTAFTSGGEQTRSEGEGADHEPDQGADARVGPGMLADPVQEELARHHRGEAEGQAPAPKRKPSQSLRRATWSTSWTRSATASRPRRSTRRRSTSRSPRFVAVRPLACLAPGLRGRLAALAAVFAGLFRGFAAFSACRLARPVPAALALSRSAAMRSTTLDAFGRWLGLRADAPPSWPAPSRPPRSRSGHRNCLGSNLPIFVLMMCSASSSISSLMVSSGTSRRHLRAGPHLVIEVQQVGDQDCRRARRTRTVRTRRNRTARARAATLLAREPFADQRVGFARPRHRSAPCSRAGRDRSRRSR